MSQDFGIIQVAHAPVRATASDASEMVTQLLFGETIDVLEEDRNWIRVRCHHDAYEGWIDQKQAYRCDSNPIEYWLKTATHRQFENCLEFNSDDGNCVLYKGSRIPADFHSGFRLGGQHYVPFKYDATLQRNLSIIEHAQSYLNTPYLWGGRSFTGIDCSGFTQMVFAFIGKQLPRNASQQVLLGKKVNVREVEAGDLAFFKNESGKVIHVGILTGQGTIIHAHGKVTEDYFKLDGIYKKNDFSKSHDLDSIKRI